jgi:uncharacterized oxidoreductase
MKITGNTVLITGGASGIGLALAEIFLAKENTVIIVGRNKTKLASAKSTNPLLHTIHGDISYAEGRSELVGEALELFPAINLLINNAGVAFFTEFTDQPELLYQQALLEAETNYLGPLHLIALLHEHLASLNDSAIVNISSASAYIPFSAMPGYSASKAALSTLTHTLRDQCLGTPIRVFEVLPPAVDTDLVKQFSMAKMSANTVANQVIKGLKKNQHEIAIGSARLLRILSRLAPNYFEHKVNLQMQRSLGHE